MRRGQEDAGGGGGGGDGGHPRVEAGVERAQAGAADWGGRRGGESVRRRLRGGEAGELGEVGAGGGEPGVGGEVGGSSHHLVERGELLQPRPREVAEREVITIPLQGLWLPPGSVFVLRVISHVLCTDSFGLIYIRPFLNVS